MFGVQVLEVINGDISVRRNVIGHFADANDVGCIVVCVRFAQMYKL